MAAQKSGRASVWDEVRRINERGTTVFLTTQYLEEADQLCDRIAIIDEGVIVREGTPRQLKSELRERRGLDSDPTLDEVFLDATGRTRERKGSSTTRRRRRRRTPTDSSSTSATSSPASPGPSARRTDSRCRTSRDRSRRRWTPSVSS